MFFDMIELCCVGFLALALVQLKCVSGSEPECVSQFNTEYQLLKKVIDLEKQVEILTKSSLAQGKELSTLQADESRGKVFFIVYVSML